MHNFAYSDDQGFAPESGSPVAEALATANQAAASFWSWKTLGERERTDLLFAMADAVDNARDVLAEVSADEVGIARAWSDFNIDIAKNILVQAADLIPARRDIEIPTASGVKSTIKRDPVGVVLGFAPWNAPVILAIRAMAA